LRRLDALKEDNYLETEKVQDQFNFEQRKRQKKIEDRIAELLKQKDDANEIL